MNGGKPKPPAKRQKSHQVTEPRCHVCQSKHRTAIERELVLGTSYKRLGEIYEIDRRSISNHDQQHLRVEDAAIRELVRREAESREEVIEEGVSGAIRRRTYLEQALRAAHEALLNGEVIVEPKDALGVIERLEKLDEHSSAAAVDEIRTQFFAFLQAVKEQVARDQWEKINLRTKELVGASKRSSQALDEGRQLEAEATEVPDGGSIPD